MIFMSHEILRVENITKRYDDKVVLNNLSLNIVPGEIIGIIGSSGAGKTTLLHTLIGFIKVDEGNIKFRQRHLITAGSQQDIYASIYKKSRYFKNMYGFASQVPSFYENLTVYENLEYFGELYDIPKESLDANIQTLLRLMNLEKASDKLAKNLSGGMERRLDIACSMIHNPDILILDEPTADLDPVLRNNIWELIQEINKRGTTVILSSHHLNELETLCTKIGILIDGEIKHLASPDDLKNKFLKEHEIILETYPGDLKKIKKEIEKTLKKDANIIIKEGTLHVNTQKPQNHLNTILKAAKNSKEKILELKVVRPNLDQIFINLNTKK